MDTAQHLHALVSPRSVALVGATPDTQKIGYTIFSNLVSGGFRGNIYPVNPKYSEIYGKVCYPRVAEIPGELDLVIIAVPAAAVLEIVEECIARQAKALVIISAGFKEVGAAGVELEARLKQRCQESGVLLLGPNSLGLITTGSQLNASFAATNAKQGNIAFASQSGAVCTALLDLANEIDLGFSHFVSLGNKAGVTEVDLQRLWLADQQVRVMGFYLEEFSDGSEFCRAPLQSGQWKPRVVIHPGSSQGAKQAIGSHTGSLAGENKVALAALRKYGINVVETVSEAYDLLLAYAWSQLPKGPRVAIVSNAGGVGIIASDVLDRYGLELAKLSEQTQAKLRKGLPETASVHNPVDVIGDAMVDRYRHAVDVLAVAPEVDAVLVLLTPQRVTQIEETAKFLAAAVRTARVPVLSVFLGGRYVEAGIERLVDQQVPVYADVPQAAAVLRAMLDYVSAQKELALPTPVAAPLNPQLHVDLQTQVAQQTPGALPEPLSIALAQTVGLDMPRGGATDNLDTALQWQRDWAVPVVLKLSSEQLLHKTEVTGVLLNLASEADLRQAWEKLQTVVSSHNLPRAAFLVQEQISSQFEVFIGAKRDPQFGITVVFGTGGIYTEIYQDLALGVAPLGSNELQTLWQKTAASKIVAGARGKGPLAQEAIFKAVQSCVRLLQEFPDIAELDLNPLLVTADRAVAVDLKVLRK